MAFYRTNTEELTSIADAVRAMNSNSLPLEYPNGFVNGIKNIPRVPVNYCGPAPGPWVRPNDWPNLDILEVGANEQVVYMTYDLRKTPGYGWLGLYIQLNGNDTITISRGHITNNEFVSDQDYIYNTSDWSVSIRMALEDTNGDVQLFKITAPKNITYFSFIPNSSTSSECYYNALQPCVERKGRLDYCILTYGGRMGNSADDKKHGTIWLEKDALIMGNKCEINRLDYVWSDCYNLHEINFDEWDTSLWNITHIRYMFDNCYCLQSIDTTTWHTENWSISGQPFTAVFENCWSLKEIKGLEDWDVSNWAISNMENTWNSCYCLEELDLSKWDVSNWRVSYFTSVWAACMNLKKLNITTWDVSDWPVYSISNCWNYCANLVELDLSNWNTSNWEAVSISGAWSNCWSLRKLNINTWNTSNWHLSTLYSAWNSCRALYELDISNWNTSNWVITDLRSVWTNCSSLKKLELNNWDTSKWAVTLMEGTWSYCYSLETLEIDEWDTSNWPLTSTYTAWYHCESLKSLDLSKWDTSNWEITSSFGYTWASCYSLQSLDLSNWNTSNWKVASCAYVWSGCYSLKSLDISHFDASNWEVTSVAYMFQSCCNIKSIKFPSSVGVSNSLSGNNPFGSDYNLIEFTGFPVAVNQSYNNSNALSVESLIAIFNALPTVTSTKTVTIGTNNMRKLTAAQIAIATEKGWTVA